MTITQEMLQLIREAEQSIVPEDLRQQGWIYWDPPGKFSFEMWDYLISLIGDAPYQLIVCSEGKDWKRGQFFLSPAAVANMRVKADEQERNSP